MIPDTTTSQGAAIAGRLRAEGAIWLTTVSRDGQPQSSPVCFLWDGGDGVLILSMEGKPKIRNIAANSRVAFHLDGDTAGGRIVTFEATATRPPRPATGPELEAYRVKYAHTFEAFHSTPEQFFADYPVALGFRLTRVRAWE